MADPVYTTTYEADDDGLSIVETPDIPAPRVTRHNIRELREELKRINAAIGAWQEKKQAVKALIDKYTEVRG